MTDLPPGWEWAPIGDICAVNPRAFDQEPDDDERISLVRMPSVEAETGRMDPSCEIRYGDYKAKSLTRFQDGDVLFAKVTPCMENGKVAVASNLIGGRALGSTELYVLRSHGAILPAFLMHYLINPSFRREAEANMTGAVGLRRVPRSYIESQFIPVPPLAEQHRIVAALEDHLSRIGVGRGLLDVNDRRLARLGKRVIVDAVPIPSSPGWGMVTVGNAGTVDLGRQRHPDWHTGRHMKPYLRVANVFEDKIDTSDLMEMDFPPDTFERFRLREGDILLNEGQSPEFLGRPAMYRGIPDAVAFTNSLLRFRSSNDVDPEWALLVFRRHMHAGRFIKEVRITTNIAHLSAGRFKTIEFPIPPLPEQRRIVSEVQSQLAEIAKMRANLDHTRVQAEALRQSLLRQAFTGRLVPQDPEDEPASALLERIRTERANQPKVKRTRRTTKQKDALL